jgi:hypothetical protein
MSSIYFDGNTYTFGATVSANPGTGTTSYVFGGLSSGSTFGFILRAFNSFGLSNLVGPVISFILSGVEEQRENINLFSWSFPYQPREGLNGFYTGSDTNLLFASDDLPNTTFWSYGLGSPGASMIGGQTGPLGEKNAFLWTSVTSGGGVILMTSETGRPVIGLPGNTYMLSFWLDASRGVTTLPAYGALNPSVYQPQTASFLALSQILPYTGTPGQDMQYAPGACGWVRYAWTFVPTSGLLEVRLLAGSAPSGSQRSVYIYGPQLELA